MAKKSKKSKKRPKEKEREASKGQLTEEELGHVAGGLAADLLTPGAVDTTINTVSTGAGSITSTSNVSIGTLSGRTRY